MSDEKRPTTGQRPGGMGPGGRRGVMPGDKPKDFSGTIKRLLGYFKPEMLGLIFVIILTITSVVFSVYAPRILGNATNELFKGIISKQLPPNVTKEQVVAMLKARGQDQFAEMISKMDLVPGAGVDFTAIGKILLTLAAIYLLAAFFQWLQQYIMAGVSQRTVYRLRRDVDQKLQRLPLKYYDNHPHGDILSRVTNDVDNIAHTLQQTITQMLSSTATVIGVLIMMFKISTLLSWISLAVIPVSLVITLLIAKQSQKQFVRQWNSTGAVNAHVEEMFTGH
ncbi:MAG TPA: ABC transporter ATP-binding protein, partial [Coprothermobacter sp.]|nr:ABC transporter ATP-binding protein [Coprothermobacter sp.]